MFLLWCEFTDKPGGYDHNFRKIGDVNINVKEDYLLSVGLTGKRQSPSSFL